MEIPFQLGGDEQPALEILNNLVDQKNIHMKTSLNINQIRILSREFYIKLINLRNEDRTYKYTADKCWNMALKLIEILLVSKRGKENRVEQVIKGVGNMQVSQNIGPGTTPATPFKNNGQ